MPEEKERGEIRNDTRRSQEGKGPNTKKSDRWRGIKSRVNAERLWTFLYVIRGNVVETSKVGKTERGGRGHDGNRLIAYPEEEREMNHYERAGVGT